MVIPDVSDVCCKAILGDSNSHKGCNGQAVIGGGACQCHCHHPYSAIEKEEKTTDDRLLTERTGDQ